MALKRDDGAGSERVPVDPGLDPDPAASRGEKADSGKPGMPRPKARGQASFAPSFLAYSPISIARWITLGRGRHCRPSPRMSECLEGAARCDRPHFEVKGFEDHVVGAGPVARTASFGLDLPVITITGMSFHCASPRISGARSAPSSAACPTRRAPSWSIGCRYSSRSPSRRCPPR